MVFPTMDILLQEDMATTPTFNALEIDNFGQKLTTGQHAVLLRLWKTQRGIHEFLPRNLLDFAN